ncbi:sterol O-acyltransferase 2 isoform X2 [Pelodiscus sinensis]|uniref:sterol O-acyltransferase 2 isoform X2 n=1 Tax=Pelodiscus sinensis TaxID=13735 RepID=UPI003F6AE010
MASRTWRRLRAACTWPPSCWSSRPRCTGAVRTSSSPTATPKASTGKNSAGHPKDSGEASAGNTQQLDSVTSLMQWRSHMEEVKSGLLEHMQVQLADLLDKAVQEAARSYPQPPRKGRLEREDRERGSLLKKRKVFVDRQSLLDELLEVEHFRTIYHMFIAVLCIFILSTIAVDFIDQGSLVLNFDLFIFAFGRLPTALFAWLVMFLHTLLVPYKALQLWAGFYRTVRFPHLFTAILWGALLACHAAVLGFYPVYMVIQHQLPPASRFIVILEQIRFLMKSHSFLRETGPGILHAKLPDGLVKPPAFSTYLYFLFCPTLIYRESYPRTPIVRWNYVAQNFAKFLGCLFYIYFILERLCIPVFTNMSKQPFSTKALVLSVFNATLPGTFLLLLFFFAFLHCWLNAFAEMLRFADRAFYKDWWNSTSFATYYRTWNVVVHDWLYYYIYQDLFWLFGGKSRVAAMLSVFITSAVVHEYVITLCFGFFYPVMFTLFAICGVTFNFLLNDKRKSPIWNIIMWTCLFMGLGIQVCLYCQEWYAQIHCPLQQKTLWGLVTPRSWSCQS